MMRSTMKHTQLTTQYECINNVMSYNSNEWISIMENTWFCTTFTFLVSISITTYSQMFYNTTTRIILFVCFFLSATFVLILAVFIFTIPDAFCQCCQYVKEFRDAIYCCLWICPSAVYHVTWCVVSRKMYICMHCRRNVIIIYHSNKLS